jgi:hypothetical protein
MVEVQVNPSDYADSILCEWCQRPILQSQPVQALAGLLCPCGLTLWTLRKEGA